MITTSFEEAGIKVGRKRTDGNLKVLCPQCSHTRTKRDDTCLSITFGKTDPAGNVCHVYNCHHCHWKGAVYENGIPDGIERLVFATPEKVYKKPKMKLDDFDLTDEVVDWFAKRGISEYTLERANIKGCMKDFDGKGKEVPTIIFPLMKNGELINAQFRNLETKKKQYRLVSGAQLIWYGIDDVVADGFVATDTLYVVEGYVDKLTLLECGFPFTLSVPQGSPFEEEGKPPVKSPVLSYFDDPDFQYVLKHITKVVFLGDADHQGRRLVSELATRMGAERCFRVTYPTDCKDPNDVLVKYGREKLIECIARAERMPVAGVVRISQLTDELRQLYVNGPNRGLSTGYENLDKIFRIGLGRMVIITGVPESGKTRLAGNIALNSARLHGVKWSMFTPESRPFANFTSKLIQIHTGKPFGMPGDEDRLSEEEIMKAAAYLDGHVTYNSPEEISVETLCSIWKQQLLTNGTRYGILDPFNYIPRPPNENEGSFVLRILTYLVNWCVTNQFTLFVIVHPTKISRGKDGEYPVVGPYNIYGSSHWYNCADFIISIWRSVTGDSDAPTQVHVMKAKQEELGTSNKFAQFHYDVKTGIYTPYDKDVYYIGRGGKPVISRSRDEGYEDDADVSVEGGFDNYDDDEADVKPIRTKRRQRGANI